MKPAPLNLISSGVEPVDELLGGLARGHLYLVHGESSGKALFGIKFLIEGLKRGESGALVINYSPEDAIRRFARVGYDCRDDVFNGRLVILECASDLTRRVGKLSEIGPVLAELKWLMGETYPNRLVFDSISHLLAGDADHLAKRVREFVCWAERFGSTSLLITNGHNDELVAFLKPHVNQSFKFEVKEAGERAVRFISFEKSKEIPEHPIEVDPTRGIFLLGQSAAPPKPARAEADSAVNIPALNQSEPGFEIDEAPELSTESPKPHSKHAADPDAAGSVPAADEEGFYTGFSLEANATTETGESEAIERPVYEIALGDDEPLEDLFDSLLFGSEKEESIAPTDSSEFKIKADAEIAAEIEKNESFDHVGNEFNDAEVDDVDGPPAEIDDSSTTGLAVDHLLSPPEPAQRADDIETLSSESKERHNVAPPARRNGHSHNEQAHREVEPSPFSSLSGVDPRSLRVLIIDSDPASLEVLGRALSEYTVETAADGVGGLLKLISFKADLIIFDVDGPVVDGFTLLAQMRSSLQTPIIAVSSAHLRSTDRIQSAYLGADYYLTKPFSVIELRQKVRQLLARYLGINEWITVPAATPPRLAEDRRAAAHRAQDLLEPETMEHLNQEPPPPEQRTETKRRDVIEARSGMDRRRAPSTESDGEQFIAYKDFTRLVEEKVNAAMVRGTAFSIVGCQLPNMTARGGDTATRLFGLIQALVRSCDCISLNEKRDFVVLLSDEDTAGAKAFINRLTARVKGEMSQEPSIWVRSFPDYEN